MRKEMSPEAARTVIVAGLKHITTGMFLLQMAKKTGWQVFAKDFSSVAEQEKISLPKQLLMPFGNYRGTPVNELPDRYLKWAHRIKWIKEPLRSAIRDEVQRRKKLVAEDEVLKAFGIRETFWQEEKE